LDTNAKTGEVIENDKSYTPVDKEYQPGQDIKNHFYGEYGHRDCVNVNNII